MGRARPLRHIAQLHAARVDCRPPEAMERSIEASTARRRQDRQIDWHYIAPGNLMQNGIIESFNGSFRDDASTRHCSRHWPGRGTKSAHGRRTTTRTDHTPRWATSRNEFARQLALEKQAA
jgi:putative transposase